MEGGEAPPSIPAAAPRARRRSASAAEAGGAADVAAAVAEARAGRARAAADVEGNVAVLRGRPRRDARRGRRAAAYVRRESTSRAALPGGTARPVPDGDALRP